MEYRQPKLLACIDNTKDACLYFNDVVPLNLGHIIPWSNNGDLEAHQVLQKILPPALLDPSHPLGFTEVVVKYVEAYVNVFPISIGVVGGSEEEMNRRAESFFPLLLRRKDEMFASLPEPIDVIFGETREISDDDVNIQDPSLVLTGLKLIDTSRISWRHLFEIREDKESIGKLRRLRTFIYQNYNGKTAAFIKDDLLNKIEDYETAAKHLGLETTDSVLKIVFSSGSIVANTAAAILSALSGDIIVAPLALALGSISTIGNIGFELRSHRRRIHKFKQDDPITYLLDLKKFEQHPSH